MSSVPQQQQASRSKSSDYAASLAAQEAQIEQVGRPCPPGFVVWKLKGVEGSGTLMLPQLLPDSPLRVLHGYRARVIADLMGICAICCQQVGIHADAPDPEHSPAGWAALEVTVGVVHAPGCGAVFDDSDKRFFDPRAFAPVSKSEGGS